MRALTFQWNCTLGSTFSGKVFLTKTAYSELQFYHFNVILNPGSLLKSYKKFMSMGNNSGHHVGAFQRGLGPK